MTARPSPTTPALGVANVPAELRTQDQWVAWRFEPREDGWTKVPYDPRTRLNASVDEPETWGSFDGAVDCARSHGFDGIGFVFTADDPYAGVDLDHCLGDDRQPVPEAQEIIDEFGSYTEVSPSGKGVKIFLRAALPGDGRGRRAKAETFERVEVYSKGRFFTVTGWRLTGSPPTVADRQTQLDTLMAKYFPMKAKEPMAKTATGGGGGGFNGADEDLVAKAMASRNGLKFRRLWEGDTSMHGDDDSAADLALMSMLAFWTARDAARMERIFSRSALGGREKWTARRDYRERTLRAAVESCADEYAPRDAASGGAESGRADGCAVHEPPHGGREHAIRAADARENDALRFETEDLALEIAEARRTPAKWTVTLRVLDRRSGECLGPIAASTSKHGVRDAAANLSGLLADADRPARDADARAHRNLLRRILDPRTLGAAARLIDARAADGAARPAGPTMVAITTTWLRDALRPGYANARGIWSEARGRTVTAGELGALAGTDLLAALEAASDHAPPTEKDPLKALRNAQLALRAGWANILRTLPDEVAADDLGPGSAAALAFRGRLVEFWNTCETWTRRTDSEGASIVERSSLAGRVRRAIERPEGKNIVAHRLGGWQRGLDGVDVFFLDGGGASGLDVTLAMRYTALRQLKNIRIEGPRNQKELVHLLRRYGLSPVAPAPATAKVGKDGVRVALLSPELSRHLVFGIDGDEPADPEPADGQGGQAGAAGPCEVIDTATGEIIGTA